MPPPPVNGLRAIINGGCYFSADGPIPIDFLEVQKWWDLAKKNKSKILAIDEVQKIPGWGEMIKKLWDSGPTLKIILTGSSSLLMEKGLTETLSGRFELIKAEH